MKKRVTTKKILIFATLTCFLFTSCATISIVGPASKKVSLLSEPEPAAYKTTKKVFYVLWGLVPITSNSTEDIIAKYNLESVRVKTQFDVVDVLISAVLGGVSVMSKTMVIEGNVGK